MASREQYLAEIESRNIVTVEDEKQYETHVPVTLTMNRELEANISVGIESLQAIESLKEGLSPLKPKTNTPGPDVSDIVTPSRVFPNRSQTNQVSDLRSRLGR
jgi:hypothetical protein